MTYDAAFTCSVALLRGLELQSGRTCIRFVQGRDVYDQVRLFIREVGDKRALLAAHRALDTAPRKRITWI